MLRIHYTGSHLLHRSALEDVFLFCFKNNNTRQTLETRRCKSTSSRLRGCIELRADELQLTLSLQLDHSKVCHIVVGAEGRDVFSGQRRQPLALNFAVYLFLVLELVEEPHNIVVNRLRALPKHAFPQVLLVDERNIVLFV